MRVVALPTRPDVPRFELEGPVIAGDLALVSSSQFGFAAVDWRRGALAWTRPAGLHVAPPIASDTTAILVGDCVFPPALDKTRGQLLGCLRLVRAPRKAAPAADQLYGAVHGHDLAPFAAARGEQHSWLVNPRMIHWQRGDHAIAINVTTGVATPAPIATPPDAGANARAHALLGLDPAGRAPPRPAGALPAIGVIGAAIRGDDAAIAVQMDTTLRHDVIATYRSGALIYVYPLPDTPRPDAVGLAITDDAVLVFHDGDSLTVLPSLSNPSTPPHVTHPSSRNPTP